jgi:hypothetical protein
LLNAERLPIRAHPTYSTFISDSVLDQISDSEFRFDSSDPHFFLNVLSFRSSANGSAKKFFKNPPAVMFRNGRVAHNL